MPYVFGYGSLVDRPSLQATIERPVGDADGPHPARLRGFRRCWNVVSHSSSHPEYAFTDASAAPWEGWIVFLGIERSAADAISGGVFRLQADDFIKLDIREFDYDRVEVTSQIDCPGAALGETVFAYVPKAQVSARARRIGSSGTIMARYLRLVDQGYRALGDELYAEHVRNFPRHGPFVVGEITVTRVDRPLPSETLRDSRPERER